MNKEIVLKSTHSKSESVLDHVVLTESSKENSIQDFASFKEEVLNRCSELHVSKTMEDLFNEYLQEIDAM